MIYPYGINPKRAQEDWRNHRHELLALLGRGLRASQSATVVEGSSFSACILVHTYTYGKNALAGDSMPERLFLK
jgi:hypothetical protein